MPLPWWDGSLSSLKTGVTVDRREACQDVRGQLRCQQQKPLDITQYVKLLSGHSHFKTIFCLLPIQEHTQVTLEVF